MTDPDDDDRQEGNEDDTQTLQPGECPADIVEANRRYGKGRKRGMNRCQEAYTKVWMLPCNHLSLYWVWDVNQATGHCARCKATKPEVDLGGEG